MSLATRLQDFITALGADIKALQTGKSAVGHTHTAGEISGLPSAGATATSVVLSATQANSTVTPAVLAGHTFTIPPGKTLQLQGVMIFQTPAATTGGALGVRVAQGAGANGNAQGNWEGEVAVGAGGSTGGLRNAGPYNVAGGANTYGEIVGTGVSAVNTNHNARMQATIKNNSSNANTTVTVEFRSEVASSACTAQIGTGFVGVVN